MKAFRLSSKPGKLGEKIAEKYLVSKGYTILARNYYQQTGKRQGEIDIIAKYQGTIHFIEVKTRICQFDRELVDPPELSVTRSKLLKMQKTAGYFLKEAKIQKAETHFDVITVLYLSEKKEARVKHFLDVFY